MKSFTFQTILFFLLIITCSACNATEYSVHIKVDMSGVTDYETVGLRGDMKPLSWDKDYELTDPDGDQIYEGQLTVKSKNTRLSYKLTKDGQFELKGGDNRKIWLKEGGNTIAVIFDEYNYLDQAALDKLSLTSDEIIEDVAVLDKVIRTVHPNLFKYQDEPSYMTSLDLLKNEMLANPDVRSAYAAVSKFGAKVQCSHTFTNPWNQTTTIDKALFYQKDKLPFTFERIGKRMFVDRTVAKNPLLISKQEVLSINGVKVDSILVTLADYIASDGSNYEKRLQRLTMDGTSKFELFDIFFSLVYGSVDKFDLVLYDHLSQDTITTSVNAITKSKRTAKLYEKYQDFGADFADSWKFEINENSTAYLKMGSFAIFSTDFKWKRFLDDAFDQIRKNKIENLIIDIRGNEGGDVAVAEYVLERTIKAPITASGSTSITAYRKIPEDIKKYISTWDKRPYNWGNKVTEITNGKYQLKPNLEDAGKTYKPKKGGFVGETYLLTDATNSSATHLMASYVKLYKLATIVGEPTGGNQKGLNGGYMFFHTLPNSRVEIDIPVFGITVVPQTADTYDGGIQPDVYVASTLDDILNDADAALAKTMSLINTK